MQYYYGPMIDLKNRRPGHFGKFLLGAWAIYVLLVIFLPSRLDALAFIPSVDNITVFRLLSIPFSFGGSGEIFVFPLILSSAAVWFFEDDVIAKLGKPKFYSYLGFTVIGGFTVSFALSFVLKPEAIIIGPNIAIALAVAMYRVHLNKPFMWGRYAFGNIRFLPWFIGFGLGLSLLMSFAKGSSKTNILGMFVTFGLCFLFFDKGHIFNLLYLRRRRRLWAMKGGRWGMH